MNFPDILIDLHTSATVIKLLVVDMFLSVAGERGECIQPSRMHVMMGLDEAVQHQDNHQEDDEPNKESCSTGNSNLYYCMDGVFDKSRLC